MANGNKEEAEQRYLQLCKQFGIGPSQPFLQCLQERSKTCKLVEFDHENQVYATANVLPYSHLQEVDFAGLKLPSDGWVTLLDSCSKCQPLRVLSLKRCNMGNLGVDVQKDLANLIGACHITVLDISNNGLGDTFMLPFSETPLTGCRSSLTVVDLSGNQFSDVGMSMLGGALEIAGLNSQLKQLDISFNTIGDKGALILASLISRISLLALELEGNQIGDAGAVALAASLKDAVCLRRLNLNNNKFSAKSLFAFGDAMRLGTSTLHELAVAGVSGGQGGIAAVLQAACSSRCLQLLDIRGLPMGLQAVHAVCQLLASPAPLVTLRMDVASKEGAELIAQALPNNRNLLHLMMGGPAPEHVLSFIAASLSSNTLSKLQQQGGLSASSMPQASSTYSAQWQQQQQQVWSPKRPASAGSNPSGSSCRARAPAGTVRSRSYGSSTGCTGNAELFTHPGEAVRPVLVRSTTQQARSLSSLDPSGIAGLAGGGAADKAAEVFRRHDSDNSGFLDAEKMMAALQDLGMLEGMKARQLGRFLTNTIREADVDQDGQVNLEDFIKYYERLARHYAEAARQGRISTRRKAPVMPVEAASDEHLKRVFKAYCKLRVGQGRQVGASIQHMNAAQFNQMCRDAGLLDPTGPLSQCAVDIVFTRCKPVPGSRRLSFKEFLEAVACVAEEAGCSFEAVSEALVVINIPNPQPSTALPDHIKGECCGSACLFAMAAAKGSLGSAHNRLRISNLLDKKIGPQLPLRAPNAASEVAVSSRCSSTLQAVSFVHAKQGHIPAADAGNNPCTAVAVPHSLIHNHAPASSASVKFAGLKMAAREPAEDQDSIGVQNPLYEAAADDKQVPTKQLEAHLSALEDKPAVRAKCRTAGATAEGSSSAEVCRDDLYSRLQSAEAQIIQQEQQLAAVVGQQEAFKEVMIRLVESIECQKSAANQATSAEVVELHQQVKALSSEVGQLRNPRAKLEEPTIEAKLQELSQRVEDRQTRAETAIYQVARQVDVLDARVRDEIDSSMSALQAILDSAAPASGR